jgi:hypothetical protein
VASSHLPAPERVDEANTLRAELAAGIGDLRAETSANFLALRERVADALVSRPAFDQQVDCAVDAAVARTRLEVREEFDRSLEVQRREISALQSEVSERIASLNARPVFDPAQSDRAVESAIARIRVEMREEFDRELDSQRRVFSAQIGELKRRMETVSGRLPVARAWVLDTVTYRGSFVVHDGSAWQATKDTAQKPGGSDWLRVARAGRDGAGLNLLGVYDVNAKYARFDLVEFADDVFVAKHDCPGLCPGTDWLKLSGARGAKGDRGEPGPRGYRGSKGEKGDPAPHVVSWQTDPARYRARSALVGRYCGPTLGDAQSV